MGSAGEGAGVVGVNVQEVIDANPWMEVTEIGEVSGIPCITGIIDGKSTLIFYENGKICVMRQKDFDEDVRYLVVRMLSPT